MNEIITYNELVSQIFYIRGKRVLLDFHLATLYEVETRFLKIQHNFSYKKKIQRKVKLQKKSQHLLDPAKQSVEIFIDKNENQAMDFIKSKMKT